MDADSIANPFPGGALLGRGACRRRGYHSSGVLMMRPSSRVTARYCSVISTVFPCRFIRTLQNGSSQMRLDFMFMASYQFFDFSQLMPSKTLISGEAYRPQPELGFLVFAAYMDVGRFVAFVGEERKFVRPRDLDGWHGISRVYNQPCVNST